MKFCTTAAILTVALPFTLADYLPELLNAAPTSSSVKERIAPPANATLYDVWYATGRRIYQCNPEKTGFQHWYTVQTHAFLYPTHEQKAPFDVPGKEIGQLAAAPLDPEHQEANPIDTIPVIYGYKDGSWIGTGRPLATTTLEPGRAERGDKAHLDDHVVDVTKSSTNGYLSHSKYVVRLGSTNGAVPPADHCTQKGMVVSKPFNAYFMFYTDAEGVDQLAKEKVEWERMVAEYTPEKLAAAKQQQEMKDKEAKSNAQKEETESNAQKEETESNTQKEEAEPNTQKEEAESNTQKEEAESNAQKEEAEPNTQKEEAESNTQKEEAESNAQKEEAKPVNEETNKPAADEKTSKPVAQEGAM